MEKCEHYTRGCKFIAPCCSNVVNCRLCHDAQYDHQIDRFLVKIVKCNRCGLRQDVTNKCIECGLIFADYFCEICRLYDTHQTNKYYHCGDCGICRVGPQEDVFHCADCNICLSIKLKDNHKCRKELFKNDCCICLNDLFTSREGAIILPCNHVIHSLCATEWLKKNIGCPICRKTMLDELSLSKYTEFMDNLIENYKIDNPSLIKMKCNDCGESNEIEFHPIGRKCPKCRSYNTTTQ
jgi:RING finger/CHY zinc finger protein 1